MELLLKYFPKLSDKQKLQFESLLPLYKEWNDKINVVSRKDIENLYLHHVLHSLSIAKFITFKPGATFLDLGTGGGFPGIPLAIFFPKSKFTLIDGTGKKVKVVEEIANAINLDNVTLLHQRAEEHKGKYDFVLSRAVTDLDQLLRWSRRLISSTHQHNIPNGLITLKGGNVKDEIKTLGKKEYTESYKLIKWFDDPFFDEKFLIYVQG